MNFCNISSSGCDDNNNNNSKSMELDSKVIT